MRHARAEIQALLERLAAGDRAAVAPAFTALWPLLVTFSLRALGNEADAQDAAQRAVAKLFAQVANFDPTRDGVAWALTIAAYEARTLRRRAERKREISDDVLAAHAAAGATPEDLLLAGERESELHDVLALLREDDARTLRAALDGARPSGDATFRKRLQRAVERVRHAWRSKHDAH